MDKDNLKDTWFEDQPTVEEITESYGIDSKQDIINFLIKQFPCDVFVHEDYIKLQFWGMELVLVRSNESYYFNDTSGG